MTIQVGWLTPHGTWDSNMLSRLLKNEIYPTGIDFEHVQGYPRYPHEGGILVIPGRFWTHLYDQINTAIAHLKWVLAIRIADEEDLFDISKIEHPNISWWVQTPRSDREYGNAHLFGVGYTPHFNRLPEKPPHKDLDVFLAGQRTHVRRELAFDTVNVLPTRISAVTHPSQGFTQGLRASDYTKLMTRAKIAVCPSGAVTPDTFRIWEALEAHCVPIVDELSPVYDSHGFWHKYFGTWLTPFPVFNDYQHLPELIDMVLSMYPAFANQCADWWMNYKRAQRYRLTDDLTELGAL